MMKGSVQMSMPLITRLMDEKMVCVTGMGVVTTPAVIVARSASGLASVSGIEAESPPCQTKNPEYALAMSSL